TLTQLPQLDRKTRERPLHRIKRLLTTPHDSPISTTTPHHTLRPSPATPCARTAIEQRAITTIAQ
ncbi:hypothetical protein, partial [Streptomyces sp. NPDC088789]|uniref:hypothetical protein n=1 Tax=Streptomyces sp. NPDC088789 TaxID=3365899 RepID=UPI003812D465